MSSVIAADAVDQAKLECADLAVPIDAGLMTWDRVLELGHVVTGQAAGRNSPEDITLFESQGIGLEDVAAAAHIFQRAQAEGVGVPPTLLGRDLAFVQTRRALRPASIRLPAGRLCRAGERDD